MMHAEFLRTVDGLMTCSALQLVRFTTEERLNEIIAIYRQRGVRINNDTLCMELGPPSMMLPSVPAIKENETNRDRYTTLTKGCGDPCHNIYINPLGFAFEDFDGVGHGDG